MSDLISRSALLERFYCEKDVSSTLWGIDGIENLILNAPTVEAKPVEWIPVEERLPRDDYDTVLCVQEDRYYFVAVYTKEHGFRTEDFYGDCDSIVAWKPIIPYDFADMRGGKNEK